MSEHLTRQCLRTFEAGGLPLGMIETGGGLHQRIETAPPGPWSGMAIGRQRNVDNAGADFCRVVRRETEARQRLRPIALRENIRVHEQIAQHAPPLLAL